MAGCAMGVQMVFHVCLLIDYRLDVADGIFWSCDLGGDAQQGGHTCCCGTGWATFWGGKDLLSAGADCGVVEQAACLSRALDPHQIWHCIGGTDHPLDDITDGVAAAVGPDQGAVGVVPLDSGSVGCVSGSEIESISGNRLGAWEGRVGTIGSSVGVITRV